MHSDPWAKAPFASSEKSATIESDAEHERAKPVEVRSMEGLCAARSTASEWLASRSAERRLGPLVEARTTSGSSLQSGGMNLGSDAQHQLATRGSFWR